MNRKETIATPFGYALVVKEFPVDREHAVAIRQPDGTYLCRIGKFVDEHWDDDQDSNP